MKNILNVMLITLLTLSLCLSCKVADKGSVTTQTATITQNQTETETTTTTVAKEVTDDVKITFSDGKVTASSFNGVEIDGENVSITASGTYILSGQSDNGSVKVKKGVTGVTLVLNGLYLTANDTAPIVCAKQSEVDIIVQEGTVNTLTDSANNNDENGNVNAENAVIKLKDGSKVVISGPGTLNIQANGKNGIKSGTDDASLTIREVTLNINAPVNDAINAETVLKLESGTLLINAGDDAIHSDYTLNIGCENATGPNITIDSCNEGLEGAVVNIYSGNISINATDDCINAANSDLNRFDFAINIYGGTINAFTTEGDGLDSNGDLNIYGGNITVWSANTSDNEPLDADGTITISGGSVLASGGSSGMGVNIVANQPCVSFSSTSEMGMPSERQPIQQEGEQMPDFNKGEKPNFENQDMSKFKGGRAIGFGGGATLLSQGSSFTITDSDGNTLYTANATCASSYVFYSSESLLPDSIYTLTSGENMRDSTALSGSISTGMGGFGGQMPNGSAPPEMMQGGFDGQTPPDWQNGNPPAMPNEG